MWQPAEGGEAISAAEAGYGTIAGGEATPAPRPRRRRADVDDEAADDGAAGAEDAAVHVDATVADDAADELAADADLDAEDADDPGRRGSGDRRDGRRSRADGAAPHVRRLPPDRPARRVGPDCGGA